MTPHLKDPIHICLEPKAQGRGMTFKLNFIESNYPQIPSYRPRICMYIIVENNSVYVFVHLFFALRGKFHATHRRCLSAGKIRTAWEDVVLHNPRRNSSADGSSSDLFYDSIESPNINANFQHKRASGRRGHT